MRLIIFILMLIILLELVQSILLPKSNEALGSYYLGAFLGEADNSLDVVAIGNSNLAHGVSMMELYNTYGYSGMVSAQPSQTMGQAYELLKRVLEHQKPKLVILEVDALFNGKKLSANAETALKDHVQNLFPVLWYHNRWKELKASDFTDVMDQSWRHYAKGYEMQTTIQPCDNVDGYMTRKYAPISIDTITAALVRRFVSTCQSADIKVLLLSVPCPKGWSAAKHTAVSEFAQKMNVSYLDLNTGTDDNGYDKPLDMDWNKDSRDGGTHLNIYGAMKVTAALGDYLSQKYELPDRKGNAQYAQWDADWKEYEGKKAEALGAAAGTR